MKNLIVALALFVSSLQGAVNQYMQPYDGRSIIDIGTQQASTDNWVFKEWYEYMPTLEQVANLIDYMPRDIVTGECAEDDVGNLLCPIRSEECTFAFEYTEGNSTAVDATVYQAPVCVNGTFNYDTVRCEAKPVCVDGTYNASTGMCETYKMVTKPLRLAHSISQLDWQDMAMVVAAVKHYLGNPYYNDYTKIPRVPTDWWAGFAYVGTPPGNIVYLAGVPYKVLITSTDPANWIQIPGGVAQTVWQANFKNLNTGAIQRVWTGKVPLHNVYYSVSSTSIIAQIRPFYTGFTTNITLASLKTVAVSPTCENGMTLDGDVCYEDWVCIDPYVKNLDDNRCQLDYIYYDYTCPDDVSELGFEWNGPLLDTGLDCLGSCGAQGCECNSATPPAQNCRRDSYECGVDPSVNCVRDVASSTDGTIGTATTVYHRPMLQWSVTGGYNGQAYGDSDGVECADTCAFSTKHIRAMGSRLIFDAERISDLEQYVEVAGNTFTGEINGDIAYLQLSGDQHTLTGYDVNGTVLGSIASDLRMNGKVGFYDSIGFNAVKADGNKMLFWNSYQGQGNQGFVEFINEVAEADQLEGYVAEDPLPYEMLLNGVGVVAEYGGHSFIASRGVITKEQCETWQSTYGYAFASFDDAQKDEFLRSLSYAVFDINAFGASGSMSNCVLESVVDHSFSANVNAIKEVVSDYFSYRCSPLKCDSDYRCALASCVVGYDGTINRTPDEPGCDAQECDGTEPYKFECGREGGCDASNPIQVEIDGSCYNLSCDPDQTLNLETKRCDALECPEGTIDIGDDKCQK